MYVQVVVMLCCVSATLIEGCGNRPAGARVVAGDNAVPNSWPWQISLQRKSPYNSWFHTCGGSLISPEYIVTAAHCVMSESRPEQYRVVVGEHDRKKNDGEVNIGVHSIHSHEGFSMKHLKNDIALIRLNKPVILNDRVGTVCLPAKDSKVAVGKKCFITGWGRTVGGGKTATILQQAEMPVSSHADCAKANKAIAPVDEKSMVCAGYAKQGVHISGCQGDSGGPFVCEENGKWVLRGAVSWGNPKCLAESTYTVFARVSSYIDWINEKTSSGGEHDRKKNDGEVNIGVHSIHSHEGFSMKHLKNDIALIRLNKPVILNDRVGTVCLPAKNSKVAVGKKCFITGWGRTVGGGKTATILQQAEMPVSSHADCAKANKAIAPVDEKSMVCAGYAKQGVHISGCQGDSGGPFVCEENGKWVLRGAVSWGNPKCLAESTYTVFARVSSYIDWINEKTSSGECKNNWGDAKCDIYKGNCNFITVKLGCKKTCNFCRRGPNGK
ncbi:Chymotrypsin-C [Exaiptasia diaphana]|nr:Chymotrypsin-C [Exaiptasia diaphana]